MTEPNGDRRKNEAQLLATAHAMTEAVIESSSKLELVDKHLIETSEESRLRITQVQRYQRQVKLLMIVLMAEAALLGVSSFYNHRLINKIDGCLNPSGACYKTAQKNQTRVVGQIVDQNHNGIPDNVEILNKLNGGK